MKKTVLLFSLALMFSSCGVDDALYEPYTTQHGVTEQKLSPGVYKLTIEGHEYLKFQEIWTTGATIAVVHSASCPAKHNFNEFGTDVADHTVENYVLEK